MNVTLYSPDGTSMETIKAVELIPVCSNSGFMCVVLESADDFEKIYGFGMPKRYFNTNLPLVAEGVTGTTMRQPELGEPSFTVKLISDAGDVIRIWRGAQGTYFLGKVFGFKVDGEWVNVTGNVPCNTSGVQLTTHLFMGKS